MQFVTTGSVSAWRQCEFRRVDSSDESCPCDALGAFSSGKTHGPACLGPCTKLYY